MRQLYVDDYIIDTPIIDILERLRVTLTNGKLRDIEPKTDNIVVSCPHHDGGLEHKAACNIYIGNDSKLTYGYCRCFVCEFQGTFLRFVAECFESSEEFAKAWLVKTFNGKHIDKPVILLDEIQLFKPKKKSVGLDPSILDTYQNWCPYLAKRKLSRETCEKFNVKYDPQYRQVIFPCYDERGRLVMMPKRAIDYKSFYLDKDVEKPVYCLDYVIKNNIKTAIITEGPFDCLTAYEYGMPAIATLGRLSDEQIGKINNSCISVLYAMFDNDEAGRQFTRTLKAKLAKLNSPIMVVDTHIPAGKKDINDLTKEEFENIINIAKNAY